MILKPLADRSDHQAGRCRGDDKERYHPHELRAGEAPRSTKSSRPDPGGLVDGNEVKMVVKKGDRVITGKYSGTEVKIDGEEMTIVRQSDILAIVE